MTVVTMAVISQESSPHRLAAQDAIPRYRWVVIGAMASGVSTSMAMLFFIGLLLPDISKELGLSPTMQGLVGSSALITNLVLVMPINTWSSRFKPRRMLAFALFLVAGSVFIQARAPVFAVLLLGRGCLALGTMFTQAPRVLLIQQWSSRRQLAMTNGILVGSVDLMMGIVSFLTPLIVVWTGDWRRALNVWGFVCLALTLAWLVLGRNRGTGEERKGAPSKEGTPLKSVLKYRELWYASIGLLGAVLAEMAFSVFWPTLAETELHLSGTMVGVAVGVSALAAAPSSIGVNAIGFFNRHRSLVLTVCGVAKCVLIVLLLYTEPAGLVILLTMLKGVFSAFFAVIMGMVFYLPNIKPREVAVSQAFLRIAISLGAAIGPLMVGFIQEATGDLQQALLYTSFMPLTLVLSSVLLRKPRRAIES